MNDLKIKSNGKICVGRNIRRIRKSRKIGQSELVGMLELKGIYITRESLVKIEREIQHIYAEQLLGIKEALNTTYDDLLEPTSSHDYDKI